MRRDILAAAVLLGPLAVLGAAGCAGRPLMDNPIFVRADLPVGPCPNPVFLPGGPPDYGVVFETCLKVLDDYFEIAVADRYDMTTPIRTHPKIAPGLDQPWKPGSPDGAERLLATLQTMRYRAEVNITPAPADPNQPGAAGGYLVQVVVFKELEDLPRPIKATAGAAAFRSDNTVDRQFEVVDPSVIESNWIPKGRETYLEQEILKRINHELRKCLKTSG
jgi:hypothetical protein